jgi:uncharacterized protein YdbL (DUF1318 family)
MHESSNIYALRHQHDSYLLTILRKPDSQSVLTEINKAFHLQLPQVPQQNNANLQHPAKAAEILMVSVNGEAFACT